MIDTIEKIPFWETLRRSFMYAVYNYKAVFKASILWFLLVDLFIMLILMRTSSLEAMYAGDGLNYSVEDFKRDTTLNFLGNVLSVVFAMAFIGTFVRFARNVILKEDKRWYQISFGKREWKSLGYTFLMGILTFGLSVILGLLMLMPAKIMELSPASIDTIFFASFFILTYVIGLAVTKLYLCFVGIAVDDKELRFRKSWDLTKGNANRIFFGSFLLLIPSVVLIMAILLLSTLFRWMGGFVSFIFVSLVFYVPFIQACLNASYFSHIYQYLEYYDKKGKKSGAAKKPAAGKGKKK